MAHNVAVFQEGIAGRRCGLRQRCSLTLGILVIVGLWTPIAGALIAASALCDAFTHHPDRTLRSASACSEFGPRAARPWRLVRGCQAVRVEAPLAWIKRIVDPSL